MNNKILALTYLVTNTALGGIPSGEVSNMDSYHKNLIEAYERFEQIKTDYIHHESTIQNPKFNTSDRSNLTEEELILEDSVLENWFGSTYMTCREHLGNVAEIDKIRSNLTEQKEDLEERGAYFPSRVTAALSALYLDSSISVKGDLDAYNIDCSPFDGSEITPSENVSESVEPQHSMPKQKTECFEIGQYIPKGDYRSGVSCESNFSTEFEFLGSSGDYRYPLLVCRNIRHCETGTIIKLNADTNFVIDITYPASMKYCEK